LTGDGGHSYIVVNEIVERVWGCEGVPVAGAANSEASLLSSPALRTLFGRLPRGAGDAAPPVEVETGRLSPTKLLIIDSISRCLSALLGIGDMSYIDVGISKHLRV
jgi:phenylpyruvate tautomerase PptA (4-oxalocrotonate tautomerase family)